MAQSLVPSLADSLAAAETMIRNLVMHVWPHKCGKWRRSAAHILQRRELFSGRKILTVATDDSTDSLEAVKEAFAGLDAEFMPFRNHGLQETQCFFPAMDLIASVRPDEITFRCHAKGASHADDLATSHPWADLLFSTCCDYLEIIDEALQDAAVAGPLRTFGLWRHPANPHGWHYSGSMYWIRHDRVFSSPNWREIMPTLWGIEAWPAKFSRQESACVFMDGIANTTAKMYSPVSWRNLIAPEFDAWRQRMKATYGRDAWLPADSAIPGMLKPVDSSVALSVIVATTGRESLTRTLASIPANTETIVIRDDPPHGDWGAWARTMGQAQATGSHLLWQDDDDIYMPGAFDIIRREISETPEAILIFQMVYPNGRTIWADPEIREGNVSTQMFCIPRAAKLGTWGTRHNGDFDFISSTVAANPGRQVRFVDWPIVRYGRNV